MDFYKYMQKVEVHIKNRVNELDSKYWYLPRRLVTAIYVAGFQDGVNETTKLSVEIAELVQDGADQDKMLVDMKFTMLMQEM